MKGETQMIKSTFSENVFASGYGLMALDRFAEAVAWLTEERNNVGLSDYADSVKVMLIVLSKDLIENIDVRTSLEIMHNIFMYAGSDDEKYLKLIEVEIDDLKRKEKEKCSEEKD